MESGPIVTRNTIKEWLVAFALCAGFGLFMWAYHDWWRAKPYTLGTADEGLALAALFGLEFCLLLGPLSRLTGAPAHMLRLRRPLGIVATGFACAHILVAVIPLYHEFNVAYFVRNWVMFLFGLAALLLLLWLSLISTAAALARLGTARWCAIQQLGWLALALVLAHFLVLGKIPKFVKWFQTRDLPAPPGTFWVAVAGVLVLGLKLADVLVARRRKTQG